MRVNRRELADVLGVSVPTITSWLDDGLPYAAQGSKGKEWAFETADVIAWYAASKFKERDGRGGGNVRDNPFVNPEDAGTGRETIEEASLRKESALADKHEIAAAREAGLLVPVDEVRAIVTEENARVRARITAIPNELRPFLLTHLKNDRKAVEKAVAQAERVITEALEEIQSYAEEDVDGDDGDSV